MPKTIREKPISATNTITARVTQVRFTVTATKP